MMYEERIIDCWRSTIDTVYSVRE